MQKGYNVLAPFTSHARRKRKGRSDAAFSLGDAVRLSVRTNVDQVLADVERALTSVTSVAAPRALNELSDQAQTAGLRKISEIYHVGPRTTERYVSIELASPSNLQATITVKGAGFPLYAFQPRQTKAGVSVQVKGRRITIPGTFLAKTKSGHVGVFARGAYGGKSGRTLRETGSFGRFKFGRGERVKRANRWGSTELPINELFTFGPAESFGNADVTAAMQDRVEEQAANVIERNIRYARGG